MDRRITRALLFGIAVLVAVSCSGSDDGVTASGPIFGTQDTSCRSVQLTNDEGDEELLESVVDCLFTELDADRPVTVDIAIATVEGDPIYYRYAFDGSTILVVEDNRADEFGNGGVIARRCGVLERTQWVPGAADCESVDHPGFPEAVR